MRTIARHALVSIVAVLGIVSSKAQAGDAARGKYLVTVMSCNDCHTPGYFFGKPDMARFLGGSDVGFEIPGLGVFHGPNLTPDKDTGLGSWTDAQVATALTTGKRPDGRELAPIMPYRAFATLAKDDIDAIVAFLRTLAPVKNKVEGPYGSAEQSAGFVMKIVPGGQKK
ncbi:MAG: c-type cytochrome [Alphaproteobacteria bacterium]|nr:c-type cytochrome [Alphaproteobacteria bacterium]